MDLSTTIKTRRSIRRYFKKPMSDEDALKILDAARLAPSAGNKQIWKFILYMKY